MEEKEGWRKEEGRRQRKNRTFTRKAAQAWPDQGLGFGKAVGSMGL
jgi:hypothetical protein